MLIAMLLAHLVGDFILQWDSLARWKSRAWGGVLVHGAIVSAVTLAACLVLRPGWWPWAAVIGVAHTAIDALWLAYGLKWPNRPLNPLGRLVADQALHFLVIGWVLAMTGNLALPWTPDGGLGAGQDNRWWLLALGYAFITMPAWILVEFTAFGLVAGTGPDFAVATNKYVGIVERGLITTFVLLGQFALVPLVTLPRLVVQGPRVVGSHRLPLFAAELAASVGLAVAVGLGLRLLMPA